MADSHTYAKRTKTTRHTTKLFAPIKAKLIQWFAEQGIVARPIFRNDPKRFGSAFGWDCPHNLLPKSPEANHITIYVEFPDADIRLENIQRIIAFHDIVAPELGYDNDSFVLQP